MKGLVSTGNHRRAALMRAIVLVGLVASGSPVRAEVPDSAGVVILARQLKNARLARIGIDGRTLVLRKPAATAAGLGYLGIEKFPNERRTIADDAGEDRVVALANPIPWQSLDRIEAGKRSGHSGTGAVVGLVTGLLLGGYAAVYAEGTEMGNGYGSVVIFSTTALTTVIGAGIGALFQTTEWTPVHSEPMKVAR